MKEEKSAIKDPSGFMKSYSCADAGPVVLALDAGSVADEVTAGPRASSKPSVSVSAGVGSVVDGLVLDAGSVVDEVPVGPGAGGEPSVRTGAGVGSIIDKLA